MGKAEKTRQLIAQKTAPIFNKKGFEATSLTDLTAATGLTKGALYGNFKDKSEIRRESFQYAMEKVRSKVRTQLGSCTSYKEQLQALLNFYAGYVLNPPIPGGCPLLNTAIEADDNDFSMRKIVTKELNSTVDFIDQLLQKGIAAGEFRGGTNTKALAYTFFCSIEGAIMFSRVERSDASMKVVVTHCKEILDQISK
ncbi:MAG: TetR/AcrR family transcriptional regulator [Cyclobacteriaceae bacterium]